MPELAALLMVGLSVGETTRVPISRGSAWSVDASLSFMLRTALTLLMVSAVESDGIIKLFLRALIRLPSPSSTAVSSV